jgi:hypothetical protein
MSLALQFVRTPLLAQLSELEKRVRALTLSPFDEIARRALQSERDSLRRTLGCREPAANSQP